MIAQTLADALPHLQTVAQPHTAQLALPKFFEPKWLLTESQFAAAVLPLIAVIVFIETGLFFPFLPGDSLLFTAGLLATSQSEQGRFPALWTVMLVATTTAVIGDNVSYWIGRRTGPALFNKPDSLLFKPKYLAATSHFFEKHGKKTLLIGHFAPTVRTFIPPAAGAGGMQYRLFFPFALVGAVLWGVGLTWLGSLLGTIPFAQEHIDLLIVAVIVVTLAPVAIGALRARTSGSGAAEPEETPEEALHSIEEVVKGD
ncbi:SNARE associated Golgi protein-related protein [Segniliparus rotundus DSM 44985]|uniref:SNARE associated Golgi protein-related protein n=1 Tax=Segniliparus rotundus (strain ATCC BAA-972 / CDC 1076 / CIP 108378 / DSM 44985 / JCM 13578) TaxID=640132 RepID=D6Z7Z6_SEGRD|nr:VTT domain-containing protein [Segniliparus rotundus]ADG98076.1 SNARE associated Golgi protein-related protein [Segniliparus rotundus DSM 44985]